MPGFGAHALLRTWEVGRGQGALDRSVTLLAAAVGSSTAEAAAADVGSRDVVLAGVLAATAPDGVVWTCVPCGGCGGLLDVEVDLSAVASCPVHPPDTVLHVVAGDDSVRVRLPTTADLLLVSGQEPASARAALLQRCMVDHPGPASAELADAVDAAIEAASPATVVEVVVHCPECASEQVAALDVPALLWAEVEARASALMLEVHALAVAYGWTEAEVLALPARRRAAYLQLAAP